MKYIFAFVVISFISSTVLFGQNHPDYYDVLVKNSSHNYNSEKTKSSLSKYISDHGDMIKVSNFGHIDVIRGINLSGYGIVDIIKIALINNPQVIKKYYLILINKKRHELQKLNLDNFFLVKGTSKGECSIAGIDNFRGNLQFSLYKIVKNSFLHSFVIDLYSNSDCAQFKYGSLNLKNSDINHDGKLDINISFKVSVLCDKDGNESEKPLSEKSISINLIARLGKQGVFWEVLK